MISLAHLDDDAAGDRLQGPLSRISYNPSLKGRDESTPLCPSDASSLGRFAGTAGGGLQNDRKF